jgi:hypothetical protein
VSRLACFVLRQPPAEWNLPWNAPCPALLPAAVNSARQLCTRHLLLALAGVLRRSLTLARHDSPARPAHSTLTACCSCVCAAPMQEQAQHQHPLPVPRVSVWSSRPLVRGAPAFLPERPSQRHRLVTICHRRISGGEQAPVQCFVPWPAAPGRCWCWCWWGRRSACSISSRRAAG